jgi:hypothetical protein
MFSSRIILAAALGCALALGGCITAERAGGFAQITQGVAIVMGETKIDPQIAKVSSRLAERCGELQMAAVGVDLFAPDKLRSAGKYGEAVISTFCAAPPKTAAELAVAIGKVAEAIAAIERARRA